MTEIILHDDSIKPIPSESLTGIPIIEPIKPIVNIPDPTPTPEPEMTVSKGGGNKVLPIDNKTRDIIVLVILIVLVIGAFMILNYINKKKIAALTTPTI